MDNKLSYIALGKITTEFHVIFTQFSHNPCFIYSVFVKMTVFIIRDIYATGTMLRY